MRMESSAVLPEASRFRLRELAGRPAQRALLSVLGGPIEKLLWIDRVNAIYRELQEQGGQDDFLARALQRLGVRYDVPPEQLKKLPPKGPLVVVANHPLGLVEGMILAHLLRQVRPDSKIMANRLLALLPATQPYIIQVDPFKTRSAKLGNRVPLKEALAWLEQGHALGMFPAGEVAHFKPGRRGIVDPPWSASVGRLILRSGADVVPVHFSGTNGALFQVAGLLHPRLRTLLLPKQILRSGIRPIDVRIGAPVSADAAMRFAGPAAVMRHLRRRTYWQGAALPHGEAHTARAWGAAWRRAPDGVAGSSRKRPERAPQPIAPAAPAQALCEELSAAAVTRALLQSGDYQVLFAPAHELPCTLQEIGRLREQSFRAVGEGTGRALDLPALPDG
jgi:putative hemolysin